MPSPSAMRPRERFNAALRREKTDCVPIFECFANARLFPHYLGRENFHSDGGPQAELARKLGLDGVFIHAGGYTSLIARTQDWRCDTEFHDEFGLRHTVSPASWPLAMANGHAFATREEWEKCPRPDPLADWRLANLRDCIARAHRDQDDDIAVVAGVRASFTVMFIGMGFDNMALAVYDDPDLLREMSAYFTDFWTKVSLRCVEAGADAVFIANDMGFNSNTLLAPETMRDIFIPDLHKQVRAIKDAGGMVILHSCGCVNPILPELVATGIDGLNPLQVAAGMDIAGVKREFGDRLTLIGNVDATNIMTSRNPDDIDEGVRAVIAAAGRDGGLILASDHSLHGSVPFVNVERFVAAGRKYGAYPLAL